MPATKQQKAIWYVLSLLLDCGEDWTRRRRTSSAEAAVAAKVAEGKFTALNKQELENRIIHGGKRGQFNKNEAIYIPPPKKNNSAVAAIWCRWDFESDHPKCGFYFGIWSDQPAFPAKYASDGQKHTAFLGFRYETPEYGNNHNYYHAQPCQSMGVPDDHIADALPISQRNPTWPLAAGSSLELLLCLVTSLYGMIGLSKLQKKVSEDLMMRNNQLLFSSIEKILLLQRNACD